MATEKDGSQGVVFFIGVSAMFGQWEKRRRKTPKAIYKQWHPLHSECHQSSIGISLSLR